MTELDSVDFFTDRTIISDPYPYFEHLRVQGPLAPLKRNVVAITGYDAAAEIYRDTDTFSSCNAVAGPFPRLPFVPEGDDISDEIERHRGGMPLSEYLVTADGAEHAAQRTLLKRILTPKRLGENEAFMWRLSSEQLDRFVDTGRCEALREYASPFSLLVIADLLGVPEEHHRTFEASLAETRGAAMTREDGPPESRDPLRFLHDTFTSYIEDRRREPRGDALTSMAQATYADGSIPDVEIVVRAATFLFAAGEDTTSRLITATLRVLAERPDVQAVVRRDRHRIPDLIEEVLRLEGPVATDFRLARRTTTRFGRTIPAGTTMMFLTGAINRDPQHFDRPDELDIDRPNAREHMAFGRGIHFCAGASLARVETRITVERFLDRTTDVRIDEEHHGPKDDRRFCYEPAFILRGLTALHLELDAAPAPVGEPHLAEATR